LPLAGLEALDTGAVARYTLRDIATHEELLGVIVEVHIGT